jgi:hypothetical protein
VPLLLAPATLVSSGSVLLELDIVSPALELAAGEGEVVFAFGLPTCEFVDCAPAELAISAPASKTAEQA